MWMTIRAIAVVCVRASEFYTHDFDLQTYSQHLWLCASVKWLEQCNLYCGIHKIARYGWSVHCTLCICTLVRVICFRRCDVHARCNSRPGGCLYFPFGICVRAQNRNSYIEHLLNWKRMPETFTRKYRKIWLWFLFPTHTHTHTRAHTVLCPQTICCCFAPSYAHFHSQTLAAIYIRPILSHMLYIADTRILSCSH